MCASACVSVYPLAPLQKFSDILKQPVSTLWQNAAKCPWDGRLLQQWACLSEAWVVCDWQWSDGVSVGEHEPRTAQCEVRTKTKSAILASSQLWVDTSSRQGQEGSQHCRRQQEVSKQRDRRVAREFVDSRDLEWRIHSNCFRAKFWCEKKDGIYTGKVNRHQHNSSLWCRGAE